MKWSEVVNVLWEVDSNILRFGDIWLALNIL